MSKSPQKRSGKFKFRVGLEAIKGHKTINEIASAYEVNPSLVSKWKKQIIDQGDEIFKTGGSKPDQQEQQEAKLYEQDHRCASVPALEDGVGVVEKKSCPLRLRTNGTWLKWDTRT